MKGKKRNNAVGVKGRSGRKTLAEEIAKRQAYIKAWNKVNDEMDLFPANVIALPIALKTMTEKSDITSGGRPLIIPSELLNKNNIATNDPNTSSSADSSINE